MDDALQPVFVPPVRRPSPLRRLIGLGIGAVLALGYWSVVAALGAIAVVCAVIMMGPAITLLFLVLCGAAWGFGLFLCGIAALLTIAPQMRRAAVAFLIGSAAANIVLVAGGALIFLGALLLPS
jgi:hypothetical protein